MKNNSKKLIIVGAGISGLSAGINALIRGFKVQIYEKNDFPGGCCTGWVKDGYYIDNCMHWLTGTNQHTKNFKLWKTLGAIDETSNLYQGQAFYKSAYQNNEISLLTNTKQLKEDMIRLSPVDLTEINRFVNTVDNLIKANQHTSFFNMPFNVAKGYLYYHKLSLSELSQKFKHPLLQKLFTDYLPGDYSALSLICAYATFASGNGKVYEQGSKQFALNIAQKFIDLGGEIFYNSNVTGIEILGNEFKSITVNNQTIEGDYLIYAADPMYLFNNLIDNKYMPSSLKQKFEDKNNNKIVSSFHVAYLVDQNFSSINEANIFEINPITVGKNKINRLLVKDYSYLYKNKDKKVIQLFIVQNTDDIEYWQNLYKDNQDEYKKIKQETITKLTDELLNKYKSLKGHIKTIDSWTPVTYNSFFNTYYGSYMGFVFKKNGSLKKFSPKIRGIKNMYYISYWQTYMGGLPIAAKLGEDVIKYL